MATYRLVNGALADVDFTGYRLINGALVKGSPTAAPAGGRIMSSLANFGGLAGKGGIAGASGGLAG